MARIRPRGEGRWEVIVYVGRRADGTRREVSRTFKGTEREAYKFGRRLEVEVEDGAHVGDGKRTTLNHAVDRWLTLTEGDLAPKTAYNYRHYYDKHVRAGLGRRALVKLGIEDFDDLYKGLQKKGLKPGTVRQVHAVIHQALKDAVRLRWIRVNPSTEAWLPARRDAEITPPDPDGVKRLLALTQLENPELALFWRLKAATGARRGEMCGLRWPRIDWDAGVVTIARSISQVPGDISEKDTKSHAIREVPLSAGLVEAMRAHWQAMYERAQEAGVELGADAYVFSKSFDGSVPWEPDLTTQRFRRLRKKAGLTDSRQHDLRHFAATEWIDRGIAVTSVSELLGHRLTSTTENMYGHGVDASKRKAADLMGEILGGPEAEEIERRSKALEAGQRFMFGSQDAKKPPAEAGGEEG